MGKVRSKKWSGAMNGWAFPRRHGVTCDAFLVTLCISVSTQISNFSIRIIAM